MDGSAPAAMTLIAEAVSISGGALVVILIFVLVLLALSVLVIVLGCRAAHRAGGGSRGALYAWLVVAFLEVLYTAPLISRWSPGLPSFVAVAFVLALVVQVLLYVRARAGRGARPARAGPPTRPLPDDGRPPSG